MKSINKREILLFIFQFILKKNKMFKFLNLIILVSAIQCITSVKENVFSLAVSDGKNKWSEFITNSFVKI
jgi:hypothetical protein